MLQHGCRVSQSAAHVDRRSIFRVCVGVITLLYWLTRLVDAAHAVYSSSSDGNGNARGVENKKEVSRLILFQLCRAPGGITTALQSLLTSSMSFPIEISPIHVTRLAALLGGMRG
ncbi:unnamed protein product [Ectocarpus fasciculatus]